MNKTIEQQQQADREERKRFRKALGHYVKSLREAAGKTQVELAAEVGLAYYTMVSQVEAGTTRIPPARIGAWAKALGVTSRELAHRALLCTEPMLFDMIFGDVWTSRVEMEGFVAS